MTVPIAYLAIVAIWSTTPLAIQWSGDSLSPIAALTSRILLATALTAVIIATLRYRAGLKQKHWKLYLYASFSLFPNMLLVYWGAQKIPSGLVSVIFAMAPFTTGLLSIIILRENPFTATKTIALCMAVVGLTAICINDANISYESLLGITAMLASTFCFSFSNVLLKRQPSIDALEQTLGALVFSLPGLVISWYIIDGNLPATISERSLFAVLYLAFIGSVLGFFAFYYVLAKLQAFSVALIPLITPGIALWLGATVNNEPITVQTVAGTLLILCGLVFYQGLPKTMLIKLLRNRQSRY